MLSIGNTLRRSNIVGIRRRVKIVERGVWKVRSEYSAAEGVEYIK